VAGDELQAALELDRRVYGRAGQEQIAIAGGTVVRHDGLPDIYTLNYLRLTAPLHPSIGAPEIAALADRWQGDRGHRRVVVEDSAAGERLGPALMKRGWERDRTLFMVLRSDPRAALCDPRAREVSDSELRAVQLATNREEDYGPHAFPGLPELLVEASAALRAGTPARGFGAGENGDLQSMCTLFVEADLHGRRAAMVEQVATLSAHRQGGLAKAAVSAALLAAGEWGAELVVVPVDADDWPQVMYASLGFAPVGRVVSFTLRAGGFPERRGSDPDAV
jgi:GNAT superfamily N-acetyltransferase